MGEIWGIAAAGVAAAGSVGSALIGSKSSASTKDPKFLRTAKEDLISRGTDLSNREQQHYTGPRIEGISSSEQAGTDLAARQSPEARSMLEKSGQAIDDSMTDYSSENLKKYMNPYTENVVQPQIREQNRQYDRNKTALVNSKGGAWGGDRSAFQTSELEKNQMEGISDITGKGYKDAFDEANNNFFNDSKRKLAASDAYARTGGDLSKMDTQDIQNLMSTGGVGRLLKQANLDTKYSDFLETRDWDVNNLDTLIQSIGAASGNTTTTKSNPGAVAGSILGAGATLAGAYFSGKVGDSGTGAPGTNTGPSQSGQSYVDTFFPK